MDGMKLQPAARLGVRLSPVGGRLATAGYVALLAMLELSGRTARTDLHDLLAGLLLLGATAGLVAHHRRRPVGWVGWLAERGRRLGQRLKKWKHRLGTDLRGTPVLPGRLPPPVWAVAGLGVLAAVAAGAAWWLAPGGWRLLGVRTVYLPYLVAVMLVWAGLLAVLAVGLAAPLLALDRRLRGRLRTADRRPAVSLALFGYLLLVLSASWVLPTAVILGLVLAVTAGAFAAAARVPAGRPGLLWRYSPGGAIHSVPARRLLGVAVGVAGVWLFALLLAACGGRLLVPPGPADPMPLTAGLGGVVAWVIPGLLAAAAAEFLHQRGHDPSRRTPATLTVHPNGRPAAEVGRASAAVRRRGWRLTVERAVQPNEVGVGLVPPDRSQAAEFDPGWPLAVSADDLAGGAVWDRLARRDEVQRRRQVFRGLAVLLKRASRGASGGGVWFAPHWWLNAGLLRDRPTGGKPGPPRRVGPAFDRVFDPRTVQHLHAVLRATQVDLIYIEDGVSRKQFDRVLRQVFEVYDVHAGRTPVEDRHFLGLPRVRVVVHDYDPGDDGRVGKYRPAKFDDLTRARVLHVFRDDDGARLEADVPSDTSWQPSPVLGVG
jgi:hypothetical protein